MSTTQAPPAPDYWDAADAESRPWERVLRDNWEQMEIDAMFTAEVSGGRTLMERAAPPCVFLVVAGIVTCAVIHVGRGMGLW